MIGCGTQLRKEDAASLKSINQLVQASVPKVSSEKVSIRTSFMVETIDTLANKGVKTGKADYAINTEHISRMKVTLGLLSERSTRASEPLNVSLKDLQESERKGKWWIVGARYRDDEQFQKKGNIHEKRNLSPQQRNHARATERDNPSLLQLARQLGLSTDVRRSIFVTIMSADDFETACDQLRKLPLNASQRIEIPRVLIRCCGAEQQYNPCYTLIARRLISQEPRLKKAFQYSLWHLLDQLHQQGDVEGLEQSELPESLDLKGLINHAKMFGTLIAEDGMAVSVLRDLNLAYPSERLQHFVEIILITVILHSQELSETGRDGKPLVAIFLKAGNDLNIIRGLRYFLKEIVSKTDIVATREEQKIVRWGCRVARDALKMVSTSTANE